MDQSVKVYELEHKITNLQNELCQKSILIKQLKHISKSSEKNMRDSPSHSGNINEIPHEIGSKNQNEILHEVGSEGKKNYLNVSSSKYLENVVFKAIK